MNGLRHVVTISVFGALACAGLQAQSVSMRANIPFEFTAGHASMPAGQYEICGSGAVLTVRKVDGPPASAYVMTMGTSGPVRAGEGRLEFHRYGDSYFLAEIWNPSSGDGRRIPQAIMEKEVARRVGPAVEATILAGKK